ALSLQNLEYYVARKTWVTILDGRERAWHGDVFGQTVQSGELFIVKDQLLSRPGDISHGATADNVCNCRCSAIYY
ncbi:phage head morphogenesis protein, partial [Fangia hongkongensis]